MTREAADAESFMANKPSNVPVRVIRMPTAEKIREGDRVVSKAAIQIVYSYRAGDQQWRFHETRLADQHGRVDLSNTLWAQLERTGDYVLRHRSGSI